MTAVLAQWRTSYAPGEWVALAGPTSLVVLLPSRSGWTPLLDAVWAEVLGSTSIIELAATLVEHGLGNMPSFGAFFWTPEGMRSLIRGAVVVRDDSSGEVIADGQDIQTWSETGLGSVTRIRIETPPGSSSETTQLPLVVGAALVSCLTLNADDDAVVRSAQDAAQLTDQPAVERDDTEPMSPEASRPDPLPATQTLPVPGPPAVQLVVSDGTTVELDQPVRIGRAPNGEGVGLVTVRSPQQDISRSHLDVWWQDGQVMVMDLNSTNGTRVRWQGDQGAERLPAGVAVPVPTGSLLDLGDEVTLLVQPFLPSPASTTNG